MRLKFSVWGLFLGLVLLAAGCAPRELGSLAKTKPPVTIQDIPTLTPAPVTPQGEPLTVGFNIRGWT